MRFCMLESHGDCTSSYSISLDKEYTVGEFIDTVLKEKSDEWGDIEVVNEGSHSYSKGRLSYGNFPLEILSKNIKKAMSHGGWTNMDYLIYI